MTQLDLARGSLALTAALLSAPTQAQVQNTQLVSELPLGAEVTDVWKDGDFAYVARRGAGLDVIDVSDAQNPALVTTLNPDPAGTVDIQDVKVHGDILYVVDESGIVDTNFGNFTGVYLYDIGSPNSPASPALVNALWWGDLMTPWSWRAAQNENVFVADIGPLTFLFVASQITNAVEIFDVTNPQQIIWKAVVYPPVLGPTIHDLCVVDEKLYTTWLSGGFTIHDVSGLTSILGPGPFDANNPPFVPPQLAWSGNLSSPSQYAYFAHPAAGGDLVAITTVDVPGQGRLELFDVSQAPTVTRLGAFTASPGSLMHNIWVRGDLAYVSSFEDGLRVVDISNPLSPVGVAWYDTSPLQPTTSTGNGVWGIFPEGNRMYLSDRESDRLLVVDVGDTVEITSITYSPGARELTVEATSSAAPLARLRVAGVGRLAYDAQSQTYRGSFAFPRRPSRVRVVSHIGGEDTDRLRRSLP